MSDLLINAIMPNFVQFPVEPMTTFENTINESYAGNQQVWNNQDHDRMEYQLNFKALTKVEIMLIIDFYNARKGSYDDFLFKDLDYNYSARASFATADGIASSFELKDGKGFKRWDIQESADLIGGVDAIIWDGGVQKTKVADYNIDYTESGDCVFTYIPVNLNNLEVQMYFYRRMRFVEDQFGYAHMSYNNIIKNGLRMREVIVP